MQESLRSARALVVSAVDCLAGVRASAAADDRVDGGPLADTESLLRQALFRMAGLLPADAAQPRRMLMETLMLEAGPPPAAEPDVRITLRWPEDAPAAPPRARRQAGSGRSRRPA